MAIRSLIVVVFKIFVNQRGIQHPFDVVHLHHGIADYFPFGVVDEYHQFATLIPGADFNTGHALERMNNRFEFFRS